MNQKVEIIQGVLSDLLQKNLENARIRLTNDWPVDSLTSQTRKTIPSTLQTQTFVRDQFHCRYCGIKTIYPGALRLISHLLPAEFPYHSHWKTDRTHPAYWEISASCDHLTPISKGGTNELTNLMTACCKCNMIKGHWSPEELGWNIREVSHVKWDGLVQLLIKAVEENSSQKWSPVLGQNN